jgi:hypothetical protein
VTDTNHFHILTPEGTITWDTFVMADQQPETIMEDCLLVVHPPSGRQFTVHRTRLISATDPLVDSLEKKHAVCQKCGKVEGIALDRVTCPYQGGADCGLLGAK